MKTNTLAVLVAATMIALSLAPMASAVPQQPLCTPPDDDPHDGNGACATIAGPASFDFKGVLGVGIGFCHSGTLPPGLPLDCTNGPGEISGAGAFVANTGSDIPAGDLTGCTAAVGCIYDIWVIQSGGIELTGWSLTVCSDRNDNGICTNVPDDEGDDFGDGYFGTEIAGEDKEKKCEKYPGKKGCEDWAHDQFCVRPDLLAVGGGYDDLWVFVGAWIDENVLFLNENDNLGIGVSAGLYDVVVEYKRDATDHDDCELTHTIHSEIEDPNH